MRNTPSVFVPCEGALNLEPECRGHGPLPVVERDERDCAGLTGQVEGGRDMLQIGASHIADPEHPLEFAGQRPIRQDPLNAGDETWFESMSLARERGTQFRLKQIRGQEPRKGIQSLGEDCRAPFVEGNRNECGRIDVGDAHASRSARNRLKAPGLRPTAFMGFLGSPEFTTIPCRSRSSSRASIVAGESRPRASPDMKP